MIDLKDVYLVTDPFEDRAFRARLAIAPDRGEELTSGAFRPRRPVNATHAMGREPRDVIWTTLIKPILAHQRLIDILERERFTGWDTYPVHVVGAGGEALHGYSGLIIRGRTGRINDQQSEIVLKNYPAGEFPIYRGLVFEPASWDGSDIFLSDDEAKWPFVHERVRSILHKEGVTNLEFVPTLLVERSEL